MADNNMMSLNIDKSMLTPVIEQQVKLLMTEVMGGSDRIINSVIEQVLKSRVDDNGKPSTYSSSKPFFEWLLIDEIKKVVQELLREEMAKKASAIKAAMKKYLQNWNPKFITTKCIIFFSIKNTAQPKLCGVFISILY